MRLHKICYDIFMDIKNIKTKFLPKKPISVSIQKIRHYPAHFHENELELIYCLKGTVSLRTSHRIVSLAEDDIFSIDADDIHCFYSDSDTVLLILHIDLRRIDIPGFDPDLFFFTCETQNLRDSQRNAMKKIRQIILASAYTHISRQTTTPDYYTDTATQLLKYMIQYFDWLSFIPDPYLNNSQFLERFRHIMRYCLDHWDQKINSEEIAQKENINKNYLSQFMKKNSFSGFKAMLNFFKCYRAEHLLLTTDKTTLEISHITGFSDPKYFYLNFKKFYQLTPSQLRNWYRNYQKKETEFQSLPKAEALSLLTEKIIADYITDDFR